MLLPLSIGLLAAGYREASIMRGGHGGHGGHGGRGPVVPADVQVVAFQIHTTRGLNAYAFAPCMGRVNRMSLRLGTIDFMLAEVAADVNMAEGHSHLGRPSFYQVDLSPIVTNIRLWPVPDDTYHLEILAFADAPPEVRAVRFNSTTEEAKRKKALWLLKSWLTREQRESLAKHNWFVVIGNKTRYRYRINHGSVFNVTQLGDSDTRIRNLCFVPDNAPYPGDIMLAQKIMLETDEERALQIANKQPLLSVS